ncbi:MAG: SusC/RagA family TonB-linked outer membrane protein [Proteiniphilum sp.]
MKRKLTMFLTLFFLGIGIISAQTQVRGIVVDDAGEPVIGATIQVKGTAQGTVTDIDGNFTLPAPANGTLVISYVGYRTQEVAVTANPRVVLVQDTELLDEVVVTALGIRRERKALGYAVQDVSSESLQRTGSADLAKSLQGKVSGIDIKSTSGMPGASSQIVIRGARSFTGDNTPLYVIDGMPIASTAAYSTGSSVTGSDISNRALDINPNDIESINILKGQAAAALYGLRASNGVVIITTKSGKGVAKGKPVISVNQTTSFEQVSRTPDYQQTWAQGIDRNYSPNSSMAWGPKISDLPNSPTYGGNVANSRNGNDATKYKGMYFVPQRENAGLDPWVLPQVYNNWDEYYQTGITSTSGVNLSQATDKGNFSFGLGYTDQEGIALNTGMNRINAKAAAETQLSDHFTLGFSANYAITDIDKLSGANDGSLAGVLGAPPSYDLEGIPFHIPGDPYTQIYYRSLTFDNPYWVAKNNTFNEKTNRFFGNGYLQYATKLTEAMSLDVKYQLGLDNYTTHYQDIFGYGSKGAKGEINNYGITRSAYNSLLTAVLDWHINDDFRLNALVGNEINHITRKSYDQYGSEFNFGGWNHVNNANTVTASESQSRERTVGFFTNLELSWQNMLYLGVTGRNDIASTMPRDNRSFFYPSTSLSFIVSELSAIKEIDWITFAKLRTSYAEVGQAGTYLNNYYSKPAYGGGFWTSDPILYPVGGVNSYISYDVLYDPNLKPQNTKSYEFGATLQLFDNRLGFDYTFSKQNVKDQIFAVPLAGSTGASSLVMNGGSVHTDVHEFVLNATPVKTKDFSWDINLNLSKIINMVDELAPGVESIFLGGFVTPQVRAGIGNTYPVIYGTQYKKNEKGQILVDEDPSSPSYGMPMAGDPGVLGEVTPDFLLGGTNVFTYKNISLAATLEWKNGGSMYSGSNGLLDLYGLSQRTEDRESTFIFDGYKADGSKNDIARGGKTDLGAYQTLYSDVLSNIDEYYIYGNSFVKLRELSVRYFFPKSVLPKLDLSLNLFARNLLLWTELPNLDPESSQGNNNMAGGFERFSLPQASSYGVGLNVVF